MEYILLEKEEGMPWSSYMQKENSLAVGAVEEDMLVAFAVYSERVNYPEYIELTYIYVEEEWREQYVAASLLEYMESELRASGYRYVLARLMEEDYIADDIYNLLMEAEFIPLQEKNKVLSYRLGDLYESKTIHTVIENCSESDRVVRIRRNSDERYEHFLHTMKRKGTDLSDIIFDLELSSFYRGKNGDYVGCILMEQKENEIILKYIYIDEARAGKYAILFLLCDALKNLDGLDEDKELIVSLLNKNYYHLFQYFFPMYQSCYDMWDYIKIL